MDQLSRARRLLRGRSYTEAEKAARAAVEATERKAGPDRLRVVEPLCLLAEVYFTQGMKAAGVAVAKRAFAIVEKTISEGEPVFASAQRIARLHMRRTGFSEAASIYRRAVALQEKSLGPDHPANARLWVELAKVCLMGEIPGKDADVELAFRRALAIREKTLPLDHPEVAASLQSLAWFYADRGRPAEAVALCERALEEKKKALGARHPAVAWGMVDLAKGYLAQGRYPAAKQLYQEALSLMQEVLGPTHPDVTRVAEAMRKDEEIRRAEEAVPRDIRAVKPQQ